MNDVLAELEKSLPTLPRAARVLLASYIAATKAAGSLTVTRAALAREIAAREGREPTANALTQTIRRTAERLKPTSLSTARETVTAALAGGADARMQRAIAGTIAHAKERAAIDAAKMVEAEVAAFRVFISYAWLDDLPMQQKMLNDFFDRLKRQLRYPDAQHGKHPAIELWRDDWKLDPADTGEQQMDKGCEDAALAVLMVSDKYPFSKACTRECAHFLDEAGNNIPGKRCLVLPVNISHAKMPDRFKHKTRLVLAPDGKAHMLDLWSAKNEPRIHAYVEKIANRILEAALAMVEENRASAPPSSLRPSSRRKPGSIGRPGATSQTERAAEWIPAFAGMTDELGDKGTKAALEDLMRARDWEPATARAEDNEIEHKGARIPVVPHLMDWAMDPSRARMVAVLGEFGMGKTVTCQLLTQRLLAERAKGLAAPLPLYLDLRELDAMAPDAKFDLNELIDGMMRKRGRAAPPAADILEMARAENVLVIFDGLDEVANKLSADQALRLYRELLRIVPEAQWTGGGGPRLLVSCRDHYFKDLESQRAFLAGQHRVVKKDVEVLTLLPFRREQIESYLTRQLPEAEAAKALALINRTYDLAGLASRPVLLDFIRTLIDDLAADAAAGRGVDLARLYDLLVRKTLARDELKHSIDLPEKQRLLEELALHLQARGGEDLHWEKLDGWLQGELVKLPKLERTLGTMGAAQLFAQDLRNASFLVRVGEDGFRFSHTSLREYFLAGALHRAVREGRGEQAFEIEGVSPAAMEFLLRRHWRDDAPERAAFEAAFPFLIKTGRSAKVRKLAFEVWKLSHDVVNGGATSSSPVARPKEVREDARPPRALPRPEVMDVSGLIFDWRRFRQLPLAHSNWNGCELRLVEFVRTDLKFSRFDAASAEGSSWIGVDIGNGSFAGGALMGSTWRSVRSARATLAGAVLTHASAFDCDDWKPQGELPATGLSLVQHDYSNSEGRSWSRGHTFTYRCEHTGVYWPEFNERVLFSISADLDQTRNSLLRAFAGHSTIFKSEDRVRRNFAKYAPFLQAQLQHGAHKFGTIRIDTDTPPNYRHPGAGRDPSGSTDNGETGMPRPKHFTLGNNASLAMDPGLRRDDGRPGDGSTGSEAGIITELSPGGEYVQYEESPEGHLLRVVACSDNAWRTWRIAAEGTEQTWPLEDAM